MSESERPTLLRRNWCGQRLSRRTGGNTTFTCDHNRLLLHLQQISSEISLIGCNRDNLSKHRSQIIQYDYGNLMPLLAFLSFRHPGLAQALKHMGIVFGADERHAVADIHVEGCGPDRHGVVKRPFGFLSATKLAESRRQSSITEWVFRV